MPWVRFPAQHKPGGGFLTGQVKAEGLAVKPSMATFTFEASLGYTRPRLQRSEKEITTEKHRKTDTGRCIWKTAPAGQGEDLELCQELNLKL